MNVLAVHTDRSWLVEDFASAGVVPVRQDHPWEAEPPRAGEAIWAPTGWAMRLIASGLDLPLTSAGLHWMSMLWQRHPHLAGRGRNIVTGQADALLRARAIPVFVKAAEAKIAALPARVHPSGGAARSYLRCAGLPADLEVMICSPIRLGQEFRCFIADGEVTASSFYLDNLTGSTWDSFQDRQDPALPRADDAVRFVRRVISELQGCHPYGFVLDVGQLSDGTWVVIEPNAAWSSAPYHADPAGVIASVLASQRPTTDPAWRFNPDPSLLARALPLRRRGSHV